MIAMARGSAPDSAGAQFFFSTGPNTALLDEQGTYVVFGRTDDAGLAVLEAIMALHEEDPSSGLGGRPSRDVVVESVTILVS
jgi:cyclophilin family peptidyl-prolyl cis-trans isomerase